MISTALKLVFTLQLVSLILPKYVHAYLDPGSGSYMIQILIATVAGFGYIIKANWAKIKKVFFNKNKGESGNEKRDKLS